MVSKKSRVVSGIAAIIDRCDPDVRHVIGRDGHLRTSGSDRFKKSDPSSVSFVAKRFTLLYKLEVSLQKAVYTMNTADFSSIKQLLPGRGAVAVILHAPTRPSIKYCTWVLSIPRHLPLCLLWQMSRGYMLAMTNESLCRICVLMPHQV